LVSGDTIFELNKHLHESSLRLIAQIHSHPGRAYHSEMDDRYAIATKEGSYSIVVPDFAVGEANLHRWVVYQLRRGRWIELGKKQGTFLLRSLFAKIILCCAPHVKDNSDDASRSDASFKRAASLGCRESVWSLAFFLPEPLEQCCIGRAEGIQRDIIDSDPAQIVMLQLLRRAPMNGLIEQREMDCQVGILMNDIHEHLADGKLYGELFTALSHEGLFLCFTRLNLAPGKFP